MVRSGGEATLSFGGGWTSEKLAILEHYLNAYTTALKNTRFQLVYIDAFAGTGKIIQEAGSDAETDARDSRAFIAGSAERALLVDDRPFDRMVFVEADPERSSRLLRLRERHHNRNVDVVTADANEFLGRLRQSEYGNWRGVLFVDPFGAQLDWKTVESIAMLERLDMWLLFPVSAIARMLPRSCDPADISAAWVRRLRRVYGGEGWRDLYAPDSQLGLFGVSGTVRAPGVGGLLTTYKNQLSTAFGERFLEESRPLTQSTNSPLFEFMFCAGHPRGSRPAKRIARHLIKRW